MNKKLLYTTPEVEVLVLQTEGVVCQSSEGDFSIGGFTDDLDALDFNSIL